MGGANGASGAPGAPRSRHGRRRPPRAWPPPRPPRSGRARQTPPAVAPLPHLVPTDPLAIALSYHENARKVDALKFPTYKPDQKCGSCMQLTGKAGDPWRPCNLFPGKLVNAEGWCKVWLKKVPVT